MYVKKGRKWFKLNSVEEIFIVFCREIEELLNLQRQYVEIPYACCLLDVIRETKGEELETEIDLLNSMSKQILLDEEVKKKKSKLFALISTKNGILNAYVKDKKFFSADDKEIKLCQ